MPAPIIHAQSRRVESEPNLCAGSNAAGTPVAIEDAASTAIAQDGDRLFQSIDFLTPIRVPFVAQSAAPSFIRQNFARLRSRLQWAATKAIGAAPFKAPLQSQVATSGISCAAPLSHRAPMGDDEDRPPEDGLESETLVATPVVTAALPLDPNLTPSASCHATADWGPGMVVPTCPSSRAVSIVSKDSRDSDNDHSQNMEDLETNFAVIAEAGPVISRHRTKESVFESECLSNSVFFSPQPAFTKPILVLDLDETLIHSSLMPRRASDFWIEVVQNDDVRTREIFWVYKRPGVDKFLAEVSEFYTIFVFTAGIREYASQILDRLDPLRTLIKGRLYRDDCTEIKGQGSFVKDLTKISDDLSRLLLVDNTPACFSLQPANGLPIRSWYSDICDRQLYRLRDFLIEIAYLQDFRQILSEWQL